VSLQLARLPCTAGSAQRSRHLRSTRAAAPVLLAHAEVTENIKYFYMGPKLRHTAVSGDDRSVKSLTRDISALVTGAGILTCADLPISDSGRIDFDPEISRAGKRSSTIEIDRLC
jgi:hypothetical protein